MYLITPPNPTSPLKYDLNNIQNEIKTTTDKHYYNTKTLNEHISDMLTKLTNIGSKIDKQEEKLTDIPSKLSNYEDLLNKLSIKETQIQP